MKIYDRMLKIKKLRAFCHSFRGVRFSFSGNASRILRGVPLFLGFWGALVVLPSLAGCRDESSGTQGNLQSKAPVVKCSESVQFETMESGYFSIGKLCGVDVAVVRSVVGKDTLVHKYVMMDSAAAALGTDLQRRGFPEEWLSAVVLRVPLKRVAALSTSQVGYMLRLGLRDNIVGVSDGQYIVDSILYERAKNKSVASIGYDAGALEKLMALNLDLVFDFTTGGDYDNYEQIARTSLPLMLTSEWQENTPLAKLEWIKLYGILFSVRPLADSIYEQEKQKYETLRNLIANSASRNGGVAGVSPARGGSELQGASEGEASPTNDSLSTSYFLPPTKQCPRVLAGMSYGGVWHASGGNSFTANLVRDAGGCYIWASDTSRELTFSFEEVYALADSVDMWVNPSAFGTVDEILSLEPRVKNIKAFREKNVFQNDGRKGPGGGNDFYEGAITRPAELLWNLTKCIKGSVPSVNSVDTTYKWYRNIYNF
ncbi:ABC transporter substrate-binding protein [Fibrobacter sp. UBA4297]|uniref:ABC transporter substrate-binding protein n=1 Tax=Fibrobacter sp. UBA4297 TaxID=1946536 RepID=UPI0025BF21B6|nr:ABC transporter substrate-binding protein [Fibrobacter sp. UBA4297]